MAKRSSTKKTVKKARPASSVKKSGPPASAKAKRSAAKPKPAATPAARRTVNAQSTVEQHADVAKLHAAIDAARWTKSVTDKLVADVPEHQITHQVQGVPNHFLWTLGHLTTFYSWATGLLGGTPTPLDERFQQRFGYKSQPVNNASAYPSLDSVRRGRDQAFHAMIEAARALGVTDVDQPTAMDSHGFAKSRLDVLHKAAWHEGWHHGQLSLLRRDLGLPGLF